MPHPPIHQTSDPQDAHVLLVIALLGLCNYDPRQLTAYAPASNLHPLLQAIVVMGLAGVDANAVRVGAAYQMLAQGLNMPHTDALDNRLLLQGQDVTALAAALLDLFIANFRGTMFRLVARTYASLPVQRAA